MKNILLIGGAGYIGSHVAKLLHQKGYSPVVYDNFSNGRKDFVKWGELVVGDADDMKTLRGCLNKFEPVATMYFASLIEVWESWKYPLLYYKNNVSGFIDAMRYLNNVVYSSSCAVYGDFNVFSSPSIEENYRKEPSSPYGRTKMINEMILEDLYISINRKYAALRYFNAAGADSDCEIGESHAPETHLIPRILDVALGKSEQIEIYGDDYPTPDGTCMRDYVHVMDIANAHFLALEKLLKNEHVGPINVGSGMFYSVREIISAVEKITGKQIKFKVMPRRAGDPSCLIADCLKAKKVLGWSPKHDLESIIQTAWNWHSKKEKPCPTN